MCQIFKLTGFFNLKGLKRVERRERENRFEKSKKRLLIIKYEVLFYKISLT